MQSELANVTISERNSQLCSSERCRREEQIRGSCGERRDEVQREGAEEKEKEEEKNKEQEKRRCRRKRNEEG